MDFCTAIYELTTFFPAHEIYGLISQLKRASVSIPSNIAEGASRNSTKEFIQFLYISNGSLSEIETQLEIAFRLKYIEEQKDLTRKIMLLRKMILNLVSALKKRTSIQQNTL